MKVQLIIIFFSMQYLIISTEIVNECYSKFSSDSKYFGSPELNRAEVKCEIRKKSKSVTGQYQTYLNSSSDICMKIDESLTHESKEWISLEWCFNTTINNKLRKPKLLRDQDIHPKFKQNRVTLLNKCCSMKEIYNSETGDCSQPPPHMNITKYTIMSKLITKFVSTSYYQEDYFLLQWLNPMSTMNCSNMTTMAINNKTNITVDNDGLKIFEMTESLNLNSGLYCVDNDINNNVIIKFCDVIKSCDNRLCVKKCCKSNQYILNEKCEDINNIKEINIPFITLEQSIY